MAKVDRTNAERQARWRKKERERQKEKLAELQAAKGIPGPPALSTVPGVKRWRELCDQARAALETVRQEIEAYIDVRSEAWQETDRAAEMQQKLDDVSEALEAVEGIEL